MCMSYLKIVTSFVSSSVILIQRSTQIMSSLFYIDEDETFKTKLVDSYLNQNVISNKNLFIKQMVIKPTTLTKSKDRQSSHKQNNVKQHILEDISLEKSNIPIKIGKHKNISNEHSDKPNKVISYRGTNNSQNNLACGKITIEMRNCTVKGFDLIYSNSNIKKTNTIEFNCSDTAFINSKSAFVIDNPFAFPSQFCFRNCLFHQNFISFITKGNNFKIDIEKCSFNQNDLCFKMIGYNSQYKTSDPRILHLKHNLFEYNSKIMLIKNISNEILIERNIIKYLFDKGFFIQNCKNIKFISNNCVKNHIPKLYQNNKEKLTKSNKNNTSSLNSFHSGNLLKLI